MEPLLCESWVSDGVGQNISFAVYHEARAQVAQVMKQRWRVDMGHWLKTYWMQLSYSIICSLVKELLSPPKGCFIFMKIS